MSRIHLRSNQQLHALVTAAALCCVRFAGAADQSATASPPKADLGSLAGQPADIAASAYAYRADRPADENPPESWILLMQHAGLPYDKPVDVNAPAIRKVLCGLIWEEVRPLRRVELSWPAEARNRPSAKDLALTCFDATDGTAHTWWNPRTVKEAGQPEVSADGRIYTYSIPVDTWGVVVAMRGQQEASTFAVPTVRAVVPEV